MSENEINKLTYIAQSVKGYGTMVERVEAMDIEQKAAES